MSKREYFHESFEMLERRGHRRHGDDRRERENERLGGVKIKVPSFKGRNDVEAYLEWELKIKQIFHVIIIVRRKK